MRWTGILVIVHGMSVMAQSEVTYLFSHGLSDSHKQVNNYTQTVNQKKPYIIQNPYISFDYPDVGKGLFKLNRLQTSLAQDNEIQRLAQIFFSSCNKESRVVLVGVSRGASTIINFMGLCNAQNVCALVLESPFDCIESIMQRMINETSWGCIPGIRKNYGSFMSFVFCKYNPYGIRPIDMVAKIRKDLPILIICSLSDKLVPVWASINLYQALRESGHEHTHLLVLPEGIHGKLIKHEHYSAWYQNVTHAFYKKYQLPHNSQYAERGAHLLDNLCQPPVNDLVTFYPDYLKSPSNSKTKLAKLNTIISEKFAVNKAKKVLK